VNINPGAVRRRPQIGAQAEEIRLKRLVLFLALAPAPAGAVDGHTIFKGPEISIADAVGDDFPRYDVAARCNAAWPGNRVAVEAARAVCIARLNRIAGLASREWRDVPAAARVNCVKRSDAAGIGGYNVLYACARAAVFTAGTREKARQIASMIRAQNGLGQLDEMAVGSIR
jgi:hypothetical protein